MFFYVLKISKKIMLGIIIIISALFLFNNNVFAQNIKTEYLDFKPFKMAFIPDMTISGEQKDDWILHNESLVIAQDVVKSLNKTENLDFVVFGGDLIDNKDMELADLPMALDVLSNLQVSYYAIPGDRDVNLAKDFIKRDFTDEFNENIPDKKDKTYWAFEPVKNILLIGLDTSIINSSSGKISEEELIWLDNILKANKDKFTIITMHHPAFPLSSTWENFLWKDYLIYNQADFQQVIQKYPQVKLVLSGHHHLGLIKNINKMLFISSPSVVTYPNQYEILTVYPNKIIIENKAISYKQIIKMAKKSIVKTDYAKKYFPVNTSEILKLQKPSSGMDNKNSFMLQ